jgi:hypothetical protein
MEAGEAGWKRGIQRRRIEFHQPIDPLKDAHLIDSVCRFCDSRFGPLCIQRKIGWGGRIRTFTILINSEVSYRLDHAPAALKRLLRKGPKQGDAAA